MPNINRNDLDALSLTNFPNNTSQQISPADLRNWLENGIDSFVTQKDSSRLENVIYENEGSDIAASATVNLANATGNYLHITGTFNGITSFGTIPAGGRFVLVFDDVCTLTYNATSLILPGASNITTAAGDCAMLVSEGSGNWRMVGFFPISGGGGGGGITALTGDVTASGTGSVTATIANGAVDIAMLSATGTPSATTFLRGDNVWETPVTSVDLTMPSAFAVSGNPITTSGTLSVTGAGLASQYVRGDGTLANFPESTGGGSSISYYLNGSINQLTISGTTYYQMSKTPVFGLGTNFTRTSASGDGYIASFITDAGDPNILSIPGGNFNIEFYFNASSGGGSPQFYAELYKYDGASLTLIASGSTNPEGITNGTTVDQYFTSIGVPTTALALTDRLAVRVYVITSGRNITLHTEDNNLCQVITTISTGLTALNGLTAQVQTFATGTSGTDFGINSTTNTHTFNIPDASDTARGLITTGAQTLAGIKTFGNGVNAGEIRFLEPSGSGINYVAIKSQAITADYSITLPSDAPTAAQYLQSTGTSGILQWTSGTTTGVSTVGTINSATKNANGAVISGSNIIMQTADASNVGLVSIGTQTFAGAKTFSASAASSATVIINPGVNSSLANPQLSITSSGGSNIQWMSLSGSSALPQVVGVSGATRSVGTKVVLAQGTSTSLDTALGTELNGLWLSTGSTAGTPLKISFYVQSSTNTAVASVGQFENSTSCYGLNIPVNGSATIASLNFSNTAATHQYIRFNSAGFADPALISARSVGTRIIVGSPGAANLYDNAIGVSATDISTMWFSGIGNFSFWSSNVTGSTTNNVLKLSGTAVLNLPLSTGRFQINGTQVVGPRDTGYTAFTGTTNENTAYATGTVTLIQLAERVAAIQASLTTHGLIGT